ncbi:MAG: AAA-like domain-containing protein [Nostoc sp. EfeVER01]|uniref:AAA-like domain-containing protein n=1 Tax=unclassified Nostoc TaxID=2593658 RepID=UPI002AD53065|nr:MULTISPECIES: AAA-like domain-containing protein [unclassified Nostoc]MDZ7944663.1 AAA-like domain-containing protein [Nostoc sp. EfeVER01]MDZ7993710.1 AAA-like domain-containing protein [Nostoc sp. EspVER01]
MPRGIRVRTECITLVKQRMREKGFARQIDLAERIDRKQSTAYNFLNGKPVDYLNFLEFCNVLDFEVKEIADFEVLADTYTQKPQKIEKINNSPSFSPSLLSTCELEYPEGEVALDSPFYVERPPIEQRCYEEIKKPGFLIRIKAPQQMGKSSLLARILHQSENQGNITVAIDFQLAEEEFFSDLNKFLRWFCDTVTEAVAGNNRELLEKLLQQLDEHWKSGQRFGYMKTCKNYFERYLFPEINQPLVLGLETVDRLFEYPKIYRDFFGLLRALHEEAKRRDIWKKLRLVLVYSTEAYVPVDINQSPFNVGLAVELLEFSHEQVKDLAQRHQLNWSDIEVEKLTGLVGGHPFLVRLALYQIARQEINLAEFLQTAATAEGIYSKHLQRLESILQQQPELWDAMQEVAYSSSPVHLPNVIRFKLYSLGLVKLQGDQVTPRCELYRQYFRSH